MEYSNAIRLHDSLAQFGDYDEYLDSKVTPVDLVYLKVSNFRFRLSKWLGARRKVVVCRPGPQFTSLPVSVHTFLFEKHKKISASFFVRWRKWKPAN